MNVFVELCWISFCIPLTGSDNINEVERKIAEFNRANPDSVVEWTGGNPMAVCSHDSQIPGGYERGSIETIFFESPITLQLPHCPAIMMSVLRCSYKLAIGSHYSCLGQLYVSGLNGEILRVGFPDNLHITHCKHPNRAIWIIYHDITESLRSRTTNRIMSYVEELTGIEKLLARYYKGNGVVPWIWNPKMLIIGKSRIHRPRPVKFTVDKRSILLERTSRAKIEMEVLNIEYDKRTERFVNGLNGQIYTVGRSSQCENPFSLALYDEIFKNERARNWKLWGVSNIFKLIRDERKHT